MSTAAMQDALLPQAPGGLRAGAAIALLVHVALVAALALGVQWRASAPDVVAAELWSALPQVAAAKLEETPAPPPTPAPVEQQAVAPATPAPRAAEPDPQIAIEQERQKKREQKLEAARLEKEQEKERQAKRDKELRETRDKIAKQEQAERKATEEKLTKQREENLRRMMGQAGATGAPTSVGAAATDAAPSRSYAGKLVAHIKPHIVFTDSLVTSSAAEVEVRAASSGAIVSRRLVKSSGSKEWDEAVLRAIDRTGSLPRDTDGRVPATIIVAFRPQE